MASTVFSDVRTGAGLVFLSGQTPLTDAGVLGGSAGEQTHAVLDKVEAALRREGVTLAEVVKVTYFLTDISDLAEVRKVLLERLPEPPPAASLVEVSALIDPRFRIEIEAVAVAKDVAPGSSS